MEKIISKLVWAVNLYSQAGDESNTRRQYFIKAKEARGIIVNEVIPELKRAVKAESKDPIKQHLFGED